MLKPGKGLHRLTRFMSEGWLILSNRVWVGDQMSSDTRSRLPDFRKDRAKGLDGAELRSDGTLSSAISIACREISFQRV